MENNAHIRELLRQLRSRDLTESEWRQMQGYAENDAFLSDALEGLKEVPNDQRMRHLSNIEKYITQSNAKRGSTGIYKWASAAAVLLILVIALFMRDKLTPPNLGTMAEAEQAESFEEVDQNVRKSEQFSPSPDIRDTDADQDQLTTPQGALIEEHSTRNASRKTAAPPRIDITAAENETQPQPAIQSRPAIAESPETDQTRADDYAQSPAQKSSRGEATKSYVDGIRVSDMNNSMLKDQKTQGQKITDEIAPKAIHIPDAAEESISAESGDDYEPIKITGMVTDDTEHPIVGAQIVLSDSRLGTNTDFDGKFTLVIPEEEEESIENADLVVSYMGFESKTIKLNHDRDIHVVLDSGVELSEVVVTGMDRKQRKTKKNTPRGKTAYALAAPVDGWESYYKYIRKEIKTPRSAKDAGIEGTVGLEFNLDKEGRPTELRVVQSLGYGCDEEAIRLVREGPRWNVEDAQVPIGRIEIDF